MKSNQFIWISINFQRNFKQLVSKTQEIRLSCEEILAFCKGFQATFQEILTICNESIAIFRIHLEMIKQQVVVYVGRGSFFIGPSRRRSIILDTFGYFWIRVFWILLDTFGYLFRFLDTFGYFWILFESKILEILDTRDFGYFWILCFKTWTRMQESKISKTWSFLDTHWN